eukprot:6384210-Prymnesium_polylepis.1
MLPLRPTTEPRLAFRYGPVLPPRPRPANTLWMAGGYRRRSMPCVPSPSRRFASSATRATAPTARRHASCGSSR